MATFSILLSAALLLTAAATTLTHTHSDSPVGDTPATAGVAQSSALTAPSDSNLLSRTEFAPPPINPCTSRYDQFYEEEAGVYAYWPLCEAHTSLGFYDYVGPFNLTPGGHSWGLGVISSTPVGPVPDDESAARIPTARSFIEGTGIPLNKHEGTLAAWINSDATSYPVTAVFLGAVPSGSEVSISVAYHDNICFIGHYHTRATQSATATLCGYNPSTWHRVILTWSYGRLILSVDGRSSSTAYYKGMIDDSLYYYRLFPGCCDTRKQMTLAKVSISNQFWTADQIAIDFRPHLPLIPPGGVIVSSLPLGTIHQDVLGYADHNQDISTIEARTALLSGLARAGVKSVRFAAGYGGLEADQEDWRGGVTCTMARGTTVPAKTRETHDTLDTYLTQIAAPLHLDVDFTLNYGSNPPACDAGANPNSIADIVHYTNIDKSYNIRYWEIGNELYSSTTETDFHPHAYSGTAYATYEPAMYAAIKSTDPRAKVGVPVGLTLTLWQSHFDYPVLADALYDAVVWHNYPLTDPISDGATLYWDRVTANVHRTRASLLKLQTELLNYGKSPNAIWVTEWNAEDAGNRWSKQTMGAVAPLFVASQLAEYMQAGVQLATWWAQGMPNGCSQFNYDASADDAYNWWRCGSTALVYAGPSRGAGEVAVGLRPGDLTPSGRAFQLLSESGFATEGEHMVRVDVDIKGAPWLLCYAATHGSSYIVMAINRDRDHVHTVPIMFATLTNGTSVRQWTYGLKEYDATRGGNWTVGPVFNKRGAWTTTFPARLPAWSVSVFAFDR